MLSDSAHKIGIISCYLKYNLIQEEFLKQIPVPVRVVLCPRQLTINFSFPGRINSKSTTLGGVNKLYTLKIWCVGSVPMANSGS